MSAYEYTGYRDSASDGKQIILRIFPVILSEINFATQALCISQGFLDKYQLVHRVIWSVSLIEWLNSTNWFR